MLIKTRGIVLRTVKYSETSLICDIYTEAKGLQTYLISGVRKKNAKTSASLLQVMSLLDLVVYHRPNKDINRTKEIKPAYIFSQIPFSVTKGAVGLFITELIQKTVKEAESNLELFEFLFQTFVLLDKTPHPIANFHLHFMVHFSRYLGFMPFVEDLKTTPFFDLKEGIFTPEEPPHADFLNPIESTLLLTLREHSMKNAHLMPIHRAQRQQLLDKLIRYYQYRIDGFSGLNAYGVFKEIF